MFANPARYSYLGDRTLFSVAVRSFSKHYYVSCSATLDITPSANILSSKTTALHLCLSTTSGFLHLAALIVE